MSHPYQCLTYCSRPGKTLDEILIAASGAYIHTFDVKLGGYLSTWPPNREVGKSIQTRLDREDESRQILVPEADDDSSTRPLKRRKLSSAREDSGSSAEIVIEHESQSAESLSTARSSIAPIVTLASDNTGQYVIAVTGEDKAIRVFELSTDGVLSPFSKR